MIRFLCAVLCSVSLLAGCATPPLAKSNGPAIESSNIGHRGYVLPLSNGYEVISAEEVQDFALLRDWMQQREEYFDRIRLDPKLKDQTFLRNGNRIIWFAVEEVHTLVPFSRLAPDQRDRLFRYAAGETQHRAIRFGENVPQLNFQRLGSHHIARTELMDEMRLERLQVFVMGNLNEFYFFDGLAAEGEGVLLEQDILTMIQELSF